MHFAKNKLAFIAARKYGHAAMSFHFNPFMFINVAETIFTSYGYPVLSQVSYAISRSTPTGKLPTFKIGIRFVSRYLIGL